MTAGTGYEQLPPGPAERIDAACDGFERAWRDGRCPLVEAHLEDVPDAERLVLVRELVLVEIAYRRLAGQAPQPAEYRARFPALPESWLDGVLSPATRGTATASVAPTRLEVLPGYEILGELGRGGMGIVYKARQVNLDRLVALKVILAGAHAEPSHFRRLRSEALAVASLQHANIVQIHEVDEHDGHPCLVLEYVEGGSLDRRLGGNPLPAREAARLTETLAHTIQYAHERGIVHRDLKPANVLLSGQDLPSSIPKLTDFGLAKWIDEEAALTQSGAILGTPCYMAPEQAIGQTKEIGPLTDVYALGALLYEMLTGRPPFQGESPIATLEQVRFQEPVSVQRLQPRVPRDLDTICLKCLRKEPQRRYSSARAMADDLRAFLAGEPIRARPVGLLGRGWSWCRRNPVVATLLIALLVVFAAGFAGVARMWRAAANEAVDKQAALGTSQANLARAEANLYLHGISLAHRDWLANRVEEAGQQLDACPTEHRRWEWHYLRRLISNRPLTLEGHEDSVRSVAFSPDGKRIASGGVDQAVKIWEAATGRLITTLPFPDAIVFPVAYSPDGRRLVTVARRRTQADVIQFWDATTSEELLSVTSPGSVFDLDFSPDGRHLATVDGDKHVRVWDVDSGKVVFGRREIALATRSVAYSPDGRSLAVGIIVPVKVNRTPSRVRLLNATTGEVVRTLPPSRFGDLGVAFSRDGQRIAASGDGSLKFWNLTAEAEESPLPCPGIFALSPDDQTVATAGPDNTVQIWSLTSRKLLFTYRGHRSTVTGLAFRPDGKRLVSCSEDRSLRIWDTSTDQEHRLRDPGNSPVTGLALSRDGRRLASAHRGPGEAQSTVRLWDVASAAPPLRLPGWKGDALCVAISPDGRYVAAGGSMDRAGTVFLWEAATGRKLVELKGHIRPVRSVAFSSDGRLASVGDDGDLRVWDVPEGRERLTIPAHPLGAYCVCFSPDGGQLATASQEPIVRVWDAATGDALRTLSGHTDAVIAVAFSPDGQQLATASRDTTVKVWDAQTGETRFTLPGSWRWPVVPGIGNVPRSVWAGGVAYSPDGQRLASLTDQVVRIWAPATGREVLALHGHADRITSVAFSGDGRRLVTAGLDATIRLWDAE